MSESIQAFSQVFTDLLLLYRRVFEQMVLPAGPPGTKRPRLKAPARLKAPG